VNALSTPDDRKRQLYDLIGSLFEIDPLMVDETTSQDSVGSWDSLGMVNLVSEIEVAFEVEFDLLEIADFKNVGLIKTIMREKGIEIA
jgi:acyl carrier protein